VIRPGSTPVQGGHKTIGSLGISLAPCTAEMGLAAAFKPPVVGLDVGSHAVKAVALRQKRGGWTLIAAGEQAMPAGATGTQDQIAEAAGTLLDTLGMTRAHIAAALSGHSVIVKRLALPPMSKAELAEAIPWEAEQYIPFALSDVQLDYQVLQGPRAMPAEALDVLLVAARRDRLSERVAAIAATGRRAIVLDVEAFALANAYEMNYPDRTDNLAALVHVGRGATLVCVLEQGQAAFTRDIGLGGGAYLEALERESGLEPMAAQRILRGAAAPGSDGISAVLRDVHQQLVLEIRKTLDFYWSAAKPSTLDRIVLSGGACQVEGLDTMLGAEFQTEVERFDPFRRVSRPASIEAEGPAYAVAVGLALRRERDR
jgi:type IV pilus assembly protein PilM